MKKLIIVLVAIMSSSVLAADKAENRANFRFKTTCRAELTGLAGSPAVISAESPEYTGRLSGFSSSQVNLALGPYILTASVQMGQPFGSASMEPTFGILLFQGDPVHGFINGIRTQGLDLEARTPGVALNSYGTSFLDFAYNGLAVTRVDYVCGIAKILD